MGIEILQNQVSLRKVISGTSLIAGTTIGAGMLGIPLVTSEAGFLPAVGVTLLVWVFMVLTGLLYVEVALSLPPGANIFSMSGHYLGKRGRIAAGGMFLFLYYCLLIAYFAGGAPLLFGSPLLFGLIFGTVVWLGAKAIDRVNLILTVGLILTYVVLVSTGSSEVKTSKLLDANWSKLCFALPVLFSAFGFHNVVPSLCTYLDRDKRSLKMSIICGTSVALVFYLLWQWMILGSLSKEAIQSTLQAGQPVTAALQSLTGKSTLFAIGQAFAFFALVTSLLGVAFSVVDFLNDGMKLKGKKRSLLVLLTFLPPGLCAAWDPAIFEKALSIAGGFGEAFLNGLLPALLAWKYRKLMNEGKVPGKGILIGILGFAAFVMAIETFLLFK